MIRKTTKAILIIMTMAAMGLAVWSTFRTGYVECELVQKRHVTIGNNHLGLFIIWWSYSGSLDEAKADVRFSIEDAAPSWIPRSGRSQRTSSNGATKNGTYSLEMELPFWLIIVLFASYPLIVPILAYGCRRIRSRGLPIYACVLVSVAIIPVTLILAGVCCYTVSLFLLVVDAPYSIRGPANVITVIISIFLIAGFLFRNLVGPVDPMLCDHCGYNLTGNFSGVCPECGNSIDAEMTIEEYQDAS
ncbi:MAG: hypothetical protein DHS20C16_07970 [Phycisphaerae bacterium]|nr:MAG: hypothetical protein DHS20C16_07970 [Phycisphaerae bacterium]